MTWLRTLVMGLTLVGGWAGSALAAPTLSQRMEKYDDYARQLERHAAAHKVTQELGTLRAWLGEARAYLKQDEEDDLKSTLRRAHAQIRLIDALLARSAAEERAAEALKAAEAKEAEAEKARDAAFAAERELAKLETSGAAAQGGSQ
jgi:hypothetical protein